MRDGVQILWADAICINQDNVEERSAQVARMAAIFKLATKVVVWLGPEADGSIDAMRTLDSIGSMVKVDWDFLSITPANTGTSPKDSEYSQTISRRPEDPTRLPSWVPDWSRPRKCRGILLAKACWDSESYARYHDGGILMVTGCYAATVRRVVPVSDHTLDLEEQDTQREFLMPVIRLLSTIQDDGSVDLGQGVEAVCRTLVCDEFADRWEPIATDRIDFRKTIKCFHALLDNTIKASDDVPIDFRKFLSTFHTTCFGRAFIFTEHGYIGLAPERCQPHDVVVMVLGCQSPMVLRPTNTAEYLVVGECYIHGMMSGELFLGSLPTNWQRVDRYAEEYGEDYDAFIDREKGVWQARDPRLGPLPEGWVEVEHPEQHLYAMFRNEVEKSITGFDPRMRPPYLRDRGFTLQEFKLV
ncbi:MAG: hypothetical protein LQ350_003144 [Teloschistes chrysophthalmus]|nr:MAG: hypothetical protein LQ350_003144 [Niorma chrysophthalma]